MCGTKSQLVAGSNQERARIGETVNVVSRKASFRFCACIGTMNRGKRRQAGRTPNASRSPRRSATARQRLECVELAPAFARGSWRAFFRFGAPIGTMKPPLTPPRRGPDRTRTNTCSPPGRGRGWVGSWKASFRFRACIGTMNRDEAAAGPLASWTAAVLCRFCARGRDPKAPEDWRTPKPRAVPAGS